MDAIHVNSTAPYFFRDPGADYTIEKFSLYCTVISALEWRKFNGRIFMVTDRVGARFYREKGLEKVWDEVLELIPEDIEGIDPEMFWAAGKLIALRDIPRNAALVDEDLIVWKKLELSEKAVTAAHREALSPDIYPDPHLFGVPEFSLLDRLDNGVLPCNTAFLYIPDDTFRVFYANQSIAFMKAASKHKCGDRLCRMVFAEQRLLAMLCELSGMPIETLMDMNKLFVAQNDYTHLWGAKQAMRDNEAQREGFIGRCRKRIMNDFPEYSDIIDALEK